MKKILLILFVIICIGSCAFAKYYDTNKQVFEGDEELPFTDLLVKLYDYRGMPLTDRTTGKQFWGYNKYINEIIKASKITIDKDNNKLIVGFEDGTFRPDDPVTKGQFLKMAIGLSVNRNFDFSMFRTSKINHWAEPYVVVAEMQNVVNPGEYNDENLNDPITRLEMMVILSKIQINMKGVSKYTDDQLPDYEDIASLTEEEKGYVLHAAKYELIENMLKSKKLEPFSNITRAEAARAIIRVY